jgi:hypothetical protein
MQVVRCGLTNAAGVCDELDLSNAGGPKTDGRAKVDPAARLAAQSSAARASVMCAQTMLGEARFWGEANVSIVEH